MVQDFDDVHTGSQPPNGGSFVYGTKPLTWATAGVPYTEQCPKDKESDVKTILFSLAYLTPIKLPFCMSTGEREREFLFKK